LYVGSIEGDIVGSTEGDPDGRAEGVFEGSGVGLFATYVGYLVGEADGSGVGFPAR